MNASSKPSANVALIQRLYTYFAQGNIGPILEALPDNMEWHGVGAPAIPYAGDFTGKEVGRFFQGMGQTLDVTEFVVNDFVERGDDLLALGIIGGTARATGQPFRSQWIMHWKFQDGKPIYFQDYIDTANFAAAIAGTPQYVGL